MLDYLNFQLQIHLTKSETPSQVQDDYNFLQDNNVSSGQLTQIKA